MLQVLEMHGFHRAVHVPVGNTEHCRWNTAVRHVDGYGVRAAAGAERFQLVRNLLPGRHLADSIHENRVVLATQANAWPAAQFHFAMLLLVDSRCIRCEGNVHNNCNIGLLALDLHPRAR